MNRKSISYICGIVITLIALFIGLFSNVLAEDLSSPMAILFNETWRDDFDNIVLNGSWSWVREDAGLWSLSANPGNLRLITHQGSLFESNNNTKNLLVQPAPGGDYVIETMVDFEPTHNFQFAGLLVYYDDDNYLQFGRAYCDLGPPSCLGNAIYFDKEIF